MQATEADVRVSTGQQPETRPGLHVTSEGRLVGHAEVNVEWDGPSDGRLEEGTILRGEHSWYGDGEERVMYVSEGTHEDLRKDAGLDPSAGAPSPPQHPNTRASTMPAVSTRVGPQGNKETVEANVSIDDVEDMEDVIDAVRERFTRRSRQQLKREGPQ